MTEHGMKINNITESITANLWNLHHFLNIELSRPEKSFDIEFNGRMFKFNPAWTIEEKLEQAQLRKTLITELMHEAMMSMLNTIHDEEEYEKDHWTFVLALVRGEDPRNHQFEIISEEVVSNLDEDGKPITSKPLNEESILVQWQDQNKGIFPSLEEELKEQYEKNASETAE
jgi:hypothetical protein